MKIWISLQGWRRGWRQVESEHRTSSQLHVHRHSPLYGRVGEIEKRLQNGGVPESRWTPGRYNTDFSPTKTKDGSTRGRQWLRQSPTLYVVRVDRPPNDTLVRVKINPPTGESTPPAGSGLISSVPGTRGTLHTRRWRKDKPLGKRVGPPGGTPSSRRRGDRCGIRGSKIRSLCGPGEDTGHSLRSEFSLIQEQRSLVMKGKRNVRRS